ncbi:MAG: hypothetical protein GX208_02550 [Firmicutes bacterium]|nr:hypothetical protein [Bacillota bacterium]
MGLLQIVSLGLALGTDSFSVSVGLGTNKLKFSRIICLSLLFSLPQAILLIIGFYSADIIEFLLSYSSLFAGLDVGIVSGKISQVCSWIGAALLAGLGCTMIYGCFCQEQELKICHYSGRLGLLALAISVSVDALTAGFGLAMLTHLPIFLIAVGSALVIWLMSFVGLSLGQRIGQWFGNKAEIFGGLLLIYLAVYLVI